MSTPKTPQAMYEELVAAIVKVVPEIRQTRYIEGCQAGKQNCGKKGEDGEYLCTWCRQWNGEDRNEDVFRPITLEDVLLAISPDKYEWDFRVQSDGSAIFDDVSQTSCPSYRWTLNKPLSEQSDSLKSFLHFLLSP